MHNLSIVYLRFADNCRNQPRIERGTDKHEAAIELGMQEKRKEFVGGGAQRFTRRRDVRGAHASSVLVSASCRNELFHDSMIAKPSSILKPISDKGYAEMGACCVSSPQARYPKKARRTSSSWIADDHLEGRQSPRNSRVNCSRLALPRRFVVAAAVSAATTSVFQVRFGEPPKPTCQRRALARGGYFSILWNRRVMLLTDMPAVKFGDDPRTLI